MNTALLFVLVIVSVMTAQKQTNLPSGKRNNEQYTAPDGGVRVVVVPVGNKDGRSEFESRIEFKSGDSKIACAVDYSSKDNEHGSRVVKAEWTPDSQYFVFSLTSSGGHQPWHALTQFLSRNDGTVRSLDDYFAPGISKADFRLVAPNTVKTEVWREDKSTAVSIELAGLPPLRSAKPFLINCLGGRVFRPDQP